MFTISITCSYCIGRARGGKYWDWQVLGLAGIGWTGRYWVTGRYWDWQVLGGLAGIGWQVLGLAGIGGRYWNIPSPVRTNRPSRTDGSTDG